MRHIKLNPDLRRDTDPDIGCVAPITTQIFYEVEVRNSKLNPSIGKGLFAKEKIRKGAIILIGGGQITSDISKVPKDKDYTVVISEKYFGAPLDFNDPTLNWYINHSCNPNIKVIGCLVLIAKRDISNSEELTCDYSVVVPGDLDYEMECCCNSKNCRKIITNEDWRNREIFFEHFEEWPPFIQKRGIGLFEGK